MRHDEGRAAEEFEKLRGEVSTMSAESAQPLDLSTHKKNREEKINSPPGLKLLVWNYEKLRSS
jgi:hypothetical protein